MQIALPDGAFLTEDASGLGWACDPGYTADAETCLPIAVPENGYLANVNYGDV